MEGVDEECGGTRWGGGEAGGRGRGRVAVSVDNSEEGVRGGVVGDLSCLYLPRRRLSLWHLKLWEPCASFGFVK